MTEHLAQLFEQSGGVDPDFETELDVARAELDGGREMIVSIDVRVTARGRPRVT